MTSESDFQGLLDVINSLIHDRTIKLICHTLLFGIYFCLIPITYHAMVTNGLQSRSRKWLFAMITSIFTLSTVYWILSIVFTVLLFDELTSNVTTCAGRDDATSCLFDGLATLHGQPSYLLGTFDGVLLVNYIITDGVIVWRAWVLCADQSRVVLTFPVVMLAIDTVFYLMMVTIGGIQLISEMGVHGPQTPHISHTHAFLNHTSNIVIVAHITFSLSINIFVTSIIAFKAWKYRKLLVESGIGIRTPKQAIRILTLLVESGMVYILIGITILASFTNVHLGISNILVPVGIQLAAIYPIVVIVLVEKNRSLISTECSFGTIIDNRGSRPSEMEPMSFAPGQVLASRGQTRIDLTTRPPNNDIQRYI